MATPLSNSTLTNTNKVLTQKAITQQSKILGGTTAGIRFYRLQNEGNGLTGYNLGPVSALVGVMNGVELQFILDIEVLQRYKNLAPRQWSGTDAIFIKDGPVIGGKWRKVAHTLGGGQDNPVTKVIRKDNIIAYYDSPGPNVALIGKDRPSQIYVVQNFTAWIVGYPIKGSSTEERLSEVIAWFSVVNIADSNWSGQNTTPKWERVSGNETGTGWKDTSILPPI